MRAVVQRVVKADVTVEDRVTGSIEKGLMVLLGVEDEDEDADAVYMAEKIAGLRIFEDEEGKMNRSVKDVGGDLLAVSQFTLFGDCRKGKRPSFIKAARPEKANMPSSTCSTAGLRTCAGNRDSRLKKGFFRPRCW